MRTSYGTNPAGEQFGVPGSPSLSARVVLGFLVLGGVPPEGFQVLNGFAARPLQANDTWRKRLPFNRCWQFGPWAV